MNTQMPFRKTAINLHSIVLMILLLAIAGCAAEYRISIPDSDPTDIQYMEAGMDAYLWGSIMDPVVEETDCEGEGINDVVVVDHLGYDLLSVITLGLWKPIHIRYRCKAPGASGNDVTFPSGSG